jgi:hypothetical protein
MKFTATVVSVSPQDRLNEAGARSKYKDVVTLSATAPVTGSIELHVPADLEWEGVEPGQTVTVEIGVPAAEGQAEPSGFHWKLDQQPTSVSSQGQQVAQPGETLQSAPGQEAQEPASPTGEPALPGASEPAAPSPEPEPVVVSAATSETADAEGLLPIPEESEFHETEETPA